MFSFPTLSSIIFTGAIERKQKLSCVLYTPASLQQPGMVGSISWEPQKAKAGGKRRQRADLALSSQWLCAIQAAKALTPWGQLPSSPVPSILQAATSTFRNSRAPNPLPGNPKAP